MREKMKQYFAEGCLVSVLTTEAMNRFLDYKAPIGGVKIGEFVEVPLGPRKILAVVWAAGEGNFNLDKVRKITKVLAITPMSLEMQLFLKRMADYTLTPMNAMLRLATRAPGLIDPVSMQHVLKKGTCVPDRMTPARTRVLDVFTKDIEIKFSAAELGNIANVSSSVIRGLVKQGALIEVKIPRDMSYPKLDHTLSGKKLNESQRQATSELISSLKGKEYQTILLKGVTGSGKTEVYLEAIAEALRQNRQSLVLLPEIALTVEFLDRFEVRFGERPAQWHSGVSSRERSRCWRMVSQGRAEVVVGARSALFLPFENLGLIIVDEEHDMSYKQEDVVFYSARDMAILRASICGALVVLASATPALETWVNARSGKYKRVNLEKRFGVAELPDMYAIDLRENNLEPGKWISLPLRDEISKRLKKNEQSLLFLNRRGYAPITICRACGYQVGCDTCDARMVEHRFHQHLMCHQCGATKSIPKLCPSCNVSGKMVPVGPGVERLYEEAAKEFPDAKIAMLSSDMALSGSELKERITAIANGEADIIIGTQLVAKGHNFPLLTCVGVIDCDLGLQGGDLRAAERSFQLIRQVAGRAGRAEKKGAAYLQTYQPDHPVIKAILKGKEEEFWQIESDQREAAGMPPFGRLAGIIISGSDLDVVSNVAMKLVQTSQSLREMGAEVFGPAPAPIAKIRGNFRVRILIKYPKNVTLQPALSAWRSALILPRNIRVNIDIDPQSFF